MRFRSEDDQEESKTTKTGRKYKYGAPVRAKPNTLLPKKKVTKKYLTKEKTKKVKACRAKASKKLKVKGKSSKKAKKAVRTLRAKPISREAGGARYSTFQPNGTSRPHVLKNPEQIAALYDEWEKTHTVNGKRIKAIAARLGLTNR
jgi:phosphoribosylformylglycinamidine (FGAM) synthase PurS component